MNAAALRIAIDDELRRYRRTQRADPAAKRREHRYETEDKQVVMYRLTDSEALAIDLALFGEDVATYNYRRYHKDGKS